MSVLNTPISNIFNTEFQTFLENYTLIKVLLSGKIKLYLDNCSVAIDVNLKHSDEKKNDFKEWYYQWY